MIDRLRTSGPSNTAISGASVVGELAHQAGERGDQVLGRIPETSGDEAHSVVVDTGIARPPLDGQDGDVTRLHPEAFQMGARGPEFADGVVDRSLGVDRRPNPGE